VFGVWSKKSNFLEEKRGGGEGGFGIKIGGNFAIFTVRIFKLINDFKSN